MRSGALKTFCLLISLVSGLSRARDAGFDFTADEYSTNLDTKVTQAKGHVEIHSEDRVVRADEVTFEAQQGRLKARGNVVLTQGKLRIQAESAELNIQNSLGEFFDAQIKVEGGMRIEGKTLKRYSPDRYLVDQGKISSCQDCPQSWSIVGSSMDIQVEEYAEIHHALFQIRDAPVAYFPVFFFPIKTKRQSGVLIPEYLYTQPLGSQIAFPYYWAISPTSDATFDYRYMTNGGHRIGSEFRYLRSGRTFAQGRASIVENKNIPGVPDERFGFSFENRWQLTGAWTQRFRGEMASDTLYPTHFEGEFANTRLPTLTNEPSLSWQNNNYFFYSLFRINRNNIPRSSNNVDDIAGTIHKIPESGFSMNSQQLAGPVRVSWDIQQTAFLRKTHQLDVDTGWVRTGNRSTANINFTAPMDVLGGLEWEPQVQLRGDHYLFDAPGIEKNAQRGRILVDQKLSSTFSRVFQTDGQDLKAIRHSITPTLRWSFSPRDWRSNHPFFDEEGAPRFDLFDPGAETAASSLGTFSEEQRLRQHNLLTLGLETRLVGRYGETSRRYEEFLGARIERDFDLREHTIGKLRVSAFGAYGGGRAATEIALDTKTGDADIRNDAGFEHTAFGVNGYQKVSGRGNDSEEVYGFGLTLRFLRPWALSAGIVYDAKLEKLRDESYVLSYSSPSDCWFFSFGVSRPVGQSSYNYAPNIKLVISEGAKGGFL